MLAWHEQRGDFYMLCCGRTDVGKRRRVNQDSFICDTFENGMMLCVVCDGMGGAAGGGIASGIACGYFVDSFADFAAAFGKKCSLDRSDERNIKSALTNAIDAANTAVYEKAAADPTLAGMGTTLVATLVYCNTLFTVNVGDSRMYLIRRNTIDQISHDHSYVQYLVDLEKITPEEARLAPNRNIITRAVGTGDTVEADIFVTHLDKRAEPHKYIGVLCSDGLTNHASPEEIATIAKEALDAESDRALGHTCEKLIELANNGGGSDNITAVIFTV